MLGSTQTPTLSGMYDLTCKRRWVSATRSHCAHMVAGSGHVRNASLPVPSPGLYLCSVAEQLPRAVRVYLRVASLKSQEPPPDALTANLKDPQHNKMLGEGVVLKGKGEHIEAAETLTRSSCSWQMGPHLWMPLSPVLPVATSFPAYVSQHWLSASAF